MCGCLSWAPTRDTWPKIQACALTGNWTSNPLVPRPALNPLSHYSQDSSFLFLSAFYLRCITATDRATYVCVRPCKTAWSQEHGCLGLLLFLPGWPWGRAWVSSDAGWSCAGWGLPWVHFEWVSSYNKHWHTSSRWLMVTRDGQDWMIGVNSPEKRLFLIQDWGIQQSLTMGR